MPYKQLKQVTFEHDNLFPFTSSIHYHEKLKENLLVFVMGDTLNVWNIDRHKLQWFKEVSLTTNRFYQVTFYLTKNIPKVVLIDVEL